MNERKKAKKLSRQEIINIHKFLSDHIKVNDDKTTAYVGTWSDQSVAEKFNVSHESVGGLRRELFGHLAGRTPKSNEELIAIKAKLNDLTIKYNKLVATLSLNKVANVNHLLITEEGG